MPTTITLFNPTAIKKDASIEVENKYASTEQQLAQVNPVIAQLLNGITVYEFTNKNAMTPSVPSHIQLEAQGIRFYFD